MLRLERIEGAVRGHFGEGGVDEGEQVVLTLSQKDADFAAGERLGEERRREARVVPDIPGRLDDFGDHDVGRSVGHERGDLLVPGMDGQPGVREVRPGERLVEPAGIDQDADVRPVDVSERTEAAGVLGPAENGLPVGQIAVGHVHRLAPGVGDGDAPDGEIEDRRIGLDVRGERRPRGLHELGADAQPGGDPLRDLDAEALPAARLRVAPGERPVVARAAHEKDAPRLDAGDDRTRRTRVLLRTRRDATARQQQQADRNQRFEEGHDAHPTISLAEAKTAFMESAMFPADEAPKPPRRGTRRGRLQTFSAIACPATRAAARSDSQWASRQARWASGWRPSIA